ncbi:MAG: hypothetical protein Q8O56_14165 [Solirubrobacteraceae bacterium]|nr:hypothetical protein [Solirubrobacteraceae bacterium]
MVRGAPGPRQRPVARLAIAAVVALIVIAAIVAATRVRDSAPEPAGAATLEDCAQIADRAEMRDCYTAAMLDELRPVRDPTAVLARIDRDVNRIGEYPAANCHTLMHTVGRRYAALRDVTLPTLMDHLPRSNDPGCAAGFAHGMITAIAPAVLRAGPGVDAVCSRAATRFQRYSCTHGLGHAYMRFHAEALEPALKLCRALGPTAAPDCAQGAYHDYWLAIAGADETTRPAGATTDPRALCERQPSEFVRACWYRAFIDTRPAGYQTQSADDLLRTCAGTSGLQRAGCITAASVIGSPNPLRQMRVCAHAQLAADDALACVRGVKVQNLVGTPAINQLRVIDRCAWFSGRVASGCYEWLGKVLAVITDGRFATSGCSQVARPESCRRGARSFNGPLVTFS